VFALLWTFFRLNRAMPPELAALFEGAKSLMSVRTKAFRLT
jgi:hypothetical protein|tara:strand:+ start:4371 stop:4493 length:123 start_codon:yes stop_codon:yes gene_type:complete